MDTCGEIGDEKHTSCMWSLLSMSFVSLLLWFSDMLTVHDHSKEYTSTRHGGYFMHGRERIDSGIAIGFLHSMDFVMRSVTMQICV